MKSTLLYLENPGSKKLEVFKSILYEMKINFSLVGLSDTMFFRC